MTTPKKPSNVTPIHPKKRAPLATAEQALAAVGRYVAFPVSSPQEAADAADVLARALRVGPGPLIVALRDMADALDDPAQLDRLASKAQAEGQQALAEAKALEAELARRAAAKGAP